MPQGFVHAVAVIAVFAIVASVAFGVGRRGRHKTDRELRAERLVQLQLREDVDCHDTGAVSAELVPYAPNFFMFNTADGWTYSAVVTADGRLTDLSRPIRMHPAE